ncbi:MAG: glutamine synthetase III, partial [Bacteroidales bacterium]
MAAVRFEALKEAFNREPRIVEAPSTKISDYYGINVFDYQKMRKYLSEEAYEKVMEAIEKGTRIDRKVADQVASGMKAWAMEKGVTHYTHWFHPLTDGTAEKHDAFIEHAPEGGVVENFSGKLLAQQEPDASSFPSGGLRNTFEARGYTAWDPTSPAFILGNTLSIPTIFVSYTGDSLDSKTPLLKALAAVDKAATQVVQYFDRNVTSVNSNLGWEQEYFLIDEALYNARPDLSLTGRTLMGHASAKDQQLEDHYFSSIPGRVMAFMNELEIEAYKLGIPVKTRHNEVAPNQYECAPIYEETNLAVDHNLLIMDTTKRVARKHKFRVLFHEKPFAGVNGSGKHNNWSLSTDTGVNLLSPGKTPRTNLMFLTFVVNTMVAVYKNQDILRASIVSAGNSHRLGANEAPPAIISVFLGSQIGSMLEEIEKKVSSKKMTPDEKTELKLNIGKIPEILLDNTDRNRTSPFAFTGNRFEFRAVGSSANCSSPMVVLNTAVADQLTKFKKDVDAIIAKGVKKDEAIFQVLRKYIIESKPIRFDGNNYSPEWEIEAKKRGLTNIK